MSNTKIKASQFHGVVGHGTDGYFLMTNADGSMSWSQASTGPSVTSVAYPGDDTAADPAGGQTVVLTGTGFATSGMTVSIGGTTAPSVAHDSNTQLTITTPAKAAGDYDIVVTNSVTGASGTFVNGISYNGVPTWTTAAGSLGTFESETTISTITLQATEPDGGTITFNITNGALPTGLSLTGANIDGTTTAESSTTLYSFTIEAIDDENQSTPRNFSITVNAAELISSENFTINTYTGNGSTQTIEGKIGTAAEFNGSSSKIDYSSYTVPTTDVTFSLWFRSANTPSATAAAEVLYAHFNGAQSYGVQIGSTTIGSYALTSGGAAAYLTSSWTHDTNWHHIAVTMGSTNGHVIYLDGTAIATNAAITSYHSGGTGTNNIGSSGSNKWFDGQIDQFRIFSKELSSSEVSTLAAESNTSTTKSTTDIFDDGSGVALYEFEKGAIDTGGVSGYIGNGGIFNGSSSDIAIPATATTPFDPSQENHTVSFWFNLSSNAADQVIIGKWYSTIRSWQVATTSSNRIIIYERGGATTYSHITTATFSTNTWHHFVYIRNGSQIITYIDNQSTPDTFSGTYALEDGGTANIQIGRQQGSTGWLNGKIDQVRIFNKELSSSEVTTLYGETSASATKSIADIFDDGSGVALYEFEGNANDTGVAEHYVFIGDGGGLLTDVRMNSISSEFTYTAPTGYSDFGGAFQTTNGYAESRWNLTESNKRATKNDTIYHAGLITENSYNSGKYYLELEFLNSDLVFGITKQSDLTQLYLTEAAENMIKFASWYTGVRAYSTTDTSSDGQVLSTNDVIGLAIDYDSKKIDYYVNNTLVTTQYLEGYNGTATNVSYAYDGTPTNVGFLGTSFQPDLVWRKDRSIVREHMLSDSVRGVNKELSSDVTDAEESRGVTSFDSNGFSLDGLTPNYNGNNEQYVAWCFKGGGAAVSNTDGSITSTVSANQDAGFSIATYTGTGSNTSFGHGLSVAPELVIIKSRTTAYNWIVHVSSLGAGAYMLLNGTNGNATSTARVNTVDSSVVNIGTSSNVNGNGAGYVCYSFHSVDGYQKVGSYTGTGSSGIQVTTGFQPRFIMIKASSKASAWLMMDTVRDSVSPITSFLVAQDSGAEFTASALGFGFNSTGFSVDNTDGTFNENGAAYIYLAIA